MTEPRSMQDWQLQDTEENAERWQLLDTEQRLPPELELRRDDATPEAEWDDWQPTEYEGDRSRSSAGWFLPSFIIVALVAVVGYVAWLAFSGPDGLNLGAISGGLGIGDGQEQTITTPETSGEPVVAVAPTTTAVQEEAAPIPTVAPPTPTPLPAPTATPTTALVEQPVARINSQYGLNARSTPSVDGEVLETLDDGASYFVASQEGDWVELLLDDGRRAWVSADFVEITIEQVPPDQAIQQPAVEPTAAPVAALGATTVLTTGYPVAAPYTNVIPAGPAVIIEAEAGVNTRTEPSTDGAIIQTVPLGAALVAVAQSDAGDWLQVELPNGETGWIFLDAVTSSGDVAALPTPGAEAAEPPADEAPIVEATPVPEEAPATDVEPQMTVDEAVIGVNARSAPNADAETSAFLTGGTVLPALGRSADGDWIQVSLESGDTAWIFAGTVQLNVDIASLPVVE